MLGWAGPRSTGVWQDGVAEVGTVKTAQQGWQGGSIARHGMGRAVQAACTQQLSALLPLPAQPQPLPHGTDGFNTFLGLFFYN